MWAVFVPYIEAEVNLLLPRYMLSVLYTQQSFEALKREDYFLSYYLECLTSLATHMLYKWIDTVPRFFQVATSNFTSFMKLHSQNNLQVFLDTRHDKMEELGESLTTLHQSFSQSSGSTFSSTLHCLRAHISMVHL